ncbi:MAG: 5-oxoprolinase/urea amidolyase family protein, partial [Caulobacteraceae bacterium]|nr:5-oxoprolinase/urea amidolyase family protein [Caulobacteraceae bacterium]
TRLQVEHGVTEQVTGVDLVEWMVRGAAGDYRFLDQWSGETQGASIQVRLYAEDPAQDYRPSSGVLTQVAFPQGVRADGWVVDGTEVSAFYDPLLAKLIVTAPDRAGAVAALQSALDQTRLEGIETNLDWLRTVVRSEAFVSGQVSTRALEDVYWTPQTIQVISGGPATSVQDWPGRQGYWDVGVPPSGPMDPLAFRLGNRLLGNGEDAAGLEITALGPTLKFNRSAVLCLTGAEFDAKLDGKPVAPYAPFVAEAGQVLKIGRVMDAGLRGYLLFQGGLDVPSYLGSRSTFTLGGFGGHAGRNLTAGDVLRLCDNSGLEPEFALSQALRPLTTRHWTIRVLSGPHGAPDFFTPDDVAMISGTDWKVHYNSNRTGVRLIGPKPQWARRDGGEAGLHPSNIHDNAYAIGAVDFTGDMPIILGPDGPSLGGFVCPFVIIQADLWKAGQLAPGDSLRFEVVNDGQAAQALAAQEQLLTLTPSLPDRAPPSAEGEGASPLLAELDEQPGRPRVL